MCLPMRLNAVAVRFSAVLEHFLHLPDQAEACRAVLGTAPITPGAGCPDEGHKVTEER